MLEHPLQQKDQSERLVDRRIGPFRVTRVAQNNNVEISDQLSRTAVVNVARLRRIERRPSHMYENANEILSPEEVSVTPDVQGQQPIAIVPFRWSRRTRKAPDRLQL